MSARFIPYKPELIAIANRLRKTMTFSEVKFWNQLKNFQMMGYDFDRQRPILNYIVDFYCKELRLVIEVDGITHQFDDAIFKDLSRDETLGKYGISVLRISAMDIVKKENYALKILENWILEYEFKNGIEPIVLKRREAFNK